MQWNLGFGFSLRAKARTAQDSPEDLENLAEKFAEEEAREINVEVFVTLGHHHLERGSNRN